MILELGTGAHPEVSGARRPSTMDMGIRPEAIAMITELRHHARGTMSPTVMVTRGVAVGGPGVLEGVMVEVTMIGPILVILLHFL